MNKYLILFYPLKEAMVSMGTATAEEKEAGIKMQMSLKDKSGDSLLDFSNPFMPGFMCDKADNFTSDENDIIGYSLMQSNSLEELQELVKVHPHLLQWL